MKGLARRPLVGIDLGSSKLCCWVLQREGQERFLGAGHVASRGIWGGQIKDLRALEESIIQLLYETEKQTQMPVRHATVALGGIFLDAISCRAKMELPHSLVTEHDMRKMVLSLQDPNFHILHAIPISFSLDQQGHITNPLGMKGRSLSAQFHVLRIDKHRFETFVQCFKRCQVQELDFIFSGQASALSCLTADEQELGTTIIDMGASSTTFCCFLHGQMTYTGSLPIGGHHATQDIARGCETPLSHAERLKTLYGAALMNVNDHHETIPLLALGTRDMEEVAPIHRSFFITIIQARYEEIFRSLKKAMEACGPHVEFQRLVFTGGASQLPGLRELAQKIFNRPVRMASPLSLSSKLPALPSFSSLTGIFLHRRKLFEMDFSQEKKTFNLFSWFTKKI